MHNARFALRMILVHWKATQCGVLICPNTSVGGNYSGAQIWDINLRAGPKQNKTDDEQNET